MTEPEPEDSRTEPEPAERSSSTRTREPLIVLDGVNKWFGDLHVLQDIDLTVGKGEVVVVIGPSGSGKSTLCRADQPAGDHRQGHDQPGRPAAARGGQGARRPCAPRWAWSSRASTSSPTRRSWRTSRSARSRSAGRRQGGGREARPRAARAGRRGAPGREVPRAALRRPAAARCDRPGAGDGPQGDALRRADLRARPGDDQGGPRRDGRPREAGHDDDRRHPRDGLRPYGGRPGRLHVRRRDRRGEHPREVLHQPQSDRAKDFLCKILKH